MKKFLGFQPILNSDTSQKALQIGLLSLVLYLVLNNNLSKILFEKVSRRGVKN